MRRNSCKPGIKYFTSVNHQFMLVNCHFATCKLLLYYNPPVYTCTLPLYCNLLVYTYKPLLYCKPPFYTCKPPFYCNPPVYERPLAEDNNFFHLKYYFSGDEAYRVVYTVEYQGEYLKADVETEAPTVDEIFASKCFQRAVTLEENVHFFYKIVLMNS